MVSFELMFVFDWFCFFRRHFKRVIEQEEKAHKGMWDGVSTHGRLPTVYVHSLFVCCETRGASGREGTVKEGDTRSRDGLPLVSYDESIPPLVKWKRFALISA